ncbi:MAG: metallophosphoesterase family protein [Rhodospirillales bacterium]|nr:metallophosphoesterase family protein [Alphaproteobacteria bacterium]MBL6948109.1 metallophosphoesterase family protein [Rhodospirillales bacterium]
MSENPVLDLGHLDGPVLCFGGPYSNAQATDALLAEAERLGIPATRMICTGDVVAYGGDSVACVERIRAAGVPVVMGNCEESLGLAANDCNCGFDEGSDCAAWSEAWFANAALSLDEDAKAWMRALPRLIRFELAGRRFAVLHGGLDNISEYVFASSPADVKTAILDRLDVDAVIGGHEGLPFTDILGDRLWHNAGAIGMPANDGTPRVWFSVLTPDDNTGRIEITLHALNYDHAGAARAIRAVTPGLPYAETLSTGLWPNMSVLPKTEQAQQGRPLTPETIFWSRPEMPYAPAAAAE